MRVHQRVKNVLLFVPLITSHRVLDWNAVALACGAFLALGPWASATYIFNDLQDLHADRVHPEKRNRPLTAGRIPITTGIVLMLILGLAGLGIAFLVSPRTPAVLLAYLIVSALYSTVFRRTLLGDVFVLAGLYCFRIL